MSGYGRESELEHYAKVAVLYDKPSEFLPCQQLAQRLGLALYEVSDQQKRVEDFFLCWRDSCLLDPQSLKKGGLKVEFDVRSEEQRSWPAPKKGPLAQAIGRKTKTVVDATCGWGQDSFFIFRMGYQLLCIERNAVMAELLNDGFKRLNQQHWMQQLGLQSPPLLHGNAIERLNALDFIPDCIYLDPMFPPKRKKSALAKKSMTMIRDLLGHDEDRVQLFESAMQATAKRVVVKSPDYAEPLGGKCSDSFKGKLVRYDVYVK